MNQWLIQCVLSALSVAKTSIAILKNFGTYSNYPFVNSKLNNANLLDMQSGLPRRKDALTPLSMLIQIEMEPVENCGGG